MRQAGRYHDHYQKLRQRYDFVSLCKVPELAAQVALGPIQDFDFDVSILFSDLLFPLEALGLQLEYAPGPRFDREIRPEDFKKFPGLDEAAEKLLFQAHAAQLTRELLPRDKSLIGFVGGPWTLFSYGVGGSHDGNLIKAKRLLSSFEAFCETMVPLLVRNIEMQLEAGCEVVMVFDTSAGELDPSSYLRYVVPQLDLMAKAHPGRVGYYSKGTNRNHQAAIEKQSGWIGLGYDHRQDLTALFSARKTGFVQGNFDQALLFSGTEDFKTHLNNYLRPFLDLDPGARAGWVCGLGHGVLPETPMDNVRRFIATVRDRFSK